MATVQPLNPAADLLSGPASGMIIGVVAADPKNFITGQALTTSPTVLNPGTSSAVFDYLNTSGSYVVIPTISVAAGSTITILQTIPVIAYGSNGWGVWRSGVSGTTFFAGNGAGAARPWLRINNVNYAQASGPIPPANGSSITIAVKIVGGGTTEVWWNGTLQYSISTPTAMPATTFTGIGMATNGTYTFGDLQGFFVWDRGLTSTELADYTANPWDMFSSGGSPVNYSLSCDAGAYSINGVDASLIYTAGSVNYSLSCSNGSYSISGVDANLVYTAGTINYSLVCSNGAYSINGVDATLTYTGGSGSYLLSCDAGSYSVSGVDANLIYTPGIGAYSLTCDSGSYLLTGVSASLVYTAGVNNYNLICSNGSYTLTGLNANLTYTPGNTPQNYLLVCSNGSYFINGQIAVLNYSGAVSVVTNSRYTVKGAKRVYTIGGKSRKYTLKGYGMKSVDWFDSKRTDEIIKVYFDFSKVSPSIASLGSVGIVVNITVHNGTDLTPTNMLLNSPAVNGLIVTQHIQNGIDGNTYKISCSITSGLEVYILEGLLPVINPK